MTMTFQQQFTMVLKENKLDKLYYSPDKMLLAYQKFVTACAEEGYEDFLVEFDYDLLVRQHIETILTNKELGAYAELAAFRQQVFETDELLKNSFIPGVERTEGRNWWEKGILKKGFSNYSDDVQEIYKVNLALFHD
jgi:hypothetical protein